MRIIRHDQAVRHSGLEVFEDAVSPPSGTRFFLVPPLLTIVSLAAKSRLSRSSTLGTHTRSIQAHLPAAQSSPPRPLGPCIADRKNRFSKGLAHGTQPLARGSKQHPYSDNPPACDGFTVEEKRAQSVRFPAETLWTRLN
jgi:hypothetical protein